jgi:hypothetical protein
VGGRLRAGLTPGPRPIRALVARQDGHTGGAATGDYDGQDDGDDRDNGPGDDDNDDNED